MFQGDPSAGSTYHGTFVPDPYRALEATESARTRVFLNAQQRATEAFLARSPHRDAIRRRLAELWRRRTMTPPLRAGNQWIHMLEDGTRNQAQVVRSDRPCGDGALLLDPTTFAADGSAAVTSLSCSRDGALLALAVARKGSDWREIRVVEVASGTLRDDVVRFVKFSSPEWLADGSGFFYLRYPEPAEGKALHAVNQAPRYCLHRLGTQQQDDVTVWADPDHPERAADGRVSDDGKQLVLEVSSGTDSRNRVALVDLVEGKPSAPRPLVDELRASYVFLGNDGPTLYFLTGDGAPRGRVVALDSSKPGPAITRVPESTDTLAAARLVADRLVLVYLHDAYHVVKTCMLDGSAVRTVALPEVGSVGALTGARVDTRAFFTFQSFLRAPEVLGLDPRTGTLEVVHRPAVAFTPARFATQQVFLQSGDGTRLPMFLVHDRGLQLDGANPTYLYGYGGFDIAQTPSFRPELIAWLEFGGMYAQPSLRGGSEYGDAWHRAGMRERKQNVFDDFFAAAHYLLRNGYTRPARLAIGGRSNGGLLVGAAMTQKPTLFGAAVPEVGVLDMLRYQEFTIGHAWIPEYGSSADPKMFPVLRAYSPLHNIQPGTHYPATLVMTGDHDDRVLPAHSYKFAAALRHAQGGPAPILLRVERNAGHGTGKPLALRIAEAADRWTFLRRVLDF
ncbi:MAG: S9 family peptidase [Planctomycetes bacterium]|nr:S9 family peptidase [Planctomycetota bacterium]